MKKIFCFALLAAMMLTCAVVFTACDDDDEKDFYCTLKYEYPEDVDRSNISSMLIYLTAPDGVETGFSAYNGDDWHTIFWTGEWSFRVRAKGMDNNGETVTLSGTAGPMKLTKETDIPIKLYKD